MLEVIYGAGRWFAYTPIEVGVEPVRSNPKGYVKPIYGEGKKMKRRIINPRGVLGRGIP
jgi:hypothetical protein